jgi:hypothetical protein
MSDASPATPPVEPGRVVPMSVGFEYHLVSLNSVDGVEAVEQRLNAWGERGWRLTGAAACNGNFGILERCRA